MDKLITTSSFAAGITVKTTVKEDNTITVTLSGSALDSILQAASSVLGVSIDSLNFDASPMEARNLAGDFNTACARAQRP